MRRVPGHGGARNGHGGARDGYGGRVMTAGALGTARQAAPTIRADP
ncbi:hypothetical protein [Streptomyces sp. NPDC008317]